MLKLLVCECGAAEPLARQVCQQAGLTDWMAIPLHKGKEHCLTVLDRFPEQYHGLLAYRALWDKIEQGGTFVIVLGYDEEYFYWANVASGSPSDMLDGTAILKRFA